MHLFFVDVPVTLSSSQIRKWCFWDTQFLKGFQNLAARSVDKAISNIFDEHQIVAREFPDKDGFNSGATRDVTSDDELIGLF